MLLQEDGNPELKDIAKLNAAYRAALADVRGRPEWRRVLGVAEIRNIIARTIVDKSRRNREISIASLSAVAIGAVKEQLLVRKDSAASI